MHFCPILAGRFNDKQTAQEVHNLGSLRILAHCSFLGRKTIIIEGDCDFHKDYLWTKNPIMSSARMSLIAWQLLFLGFIGAATDVHGLEVPLQHSSQLVA